MTECFSQQNGNVFKMNRSNTKITLLADFKSAANIYGSLLFGCNDHNIHTWTFKIVNCPSKYIVIGIDEEENMEKHGRFFMNKGSVAYSSDGYGWNNGVIVRGYGDIYSTGDTIKMILNNNNSTISFTKTSKNWWGSKQIKHYKPFKIQNKQKKYKMCVMLNSKDDSIELLSYSCSMHGDVNNNILKDVESNQNNNDSQLSMALKVSLKEYKEKQAIKSSEKKENKKKNGVDLEIAELKTKCNQILQQKEEFEQANQRQRSRIISIEEQMEILRNERDSIQNKYISLQSDYNDSIKEQKELQIENKELKDEIEKLMLKLKKIENGGYYK